MSVHRVAVMTSGLWRIRNIISVATGCRVTRWLPGIGSGRCDGVAGWGHKPTAARAQSLARRIGMPYVALEDGWLRSVCAGPWEKPRSLVMDRTGIYYDATASSDLERLIGESASIRDERRHSRASRAMALLRQTAISKYNDGPWLTAAELGLDPARRRRVLVVDQTFGDASVSCGLAKAETFLRMLAAAEAEHPGAEIIVKVHPEVVSGRKRGYLEHVDPDRYSVVDVAVNPWVLLGLVDHVYVVSSQLGFEALIAGLPVSCFGAPYYAGWGLTDDRIAIPRRTARPSLEQLFAAAYFDYAVYIDPATGRRATLEETVHALAAERERRTLARLHPRMNGGDIGWQPCTYAAMLP